MRLPEEGPARSTVRRRRFSRLASPHDPRARFCGASPVGSLRSGDLAGGASPGPGHLLRGRPGGGRARFDGGGAVVRWAWGRRGRACPAPDDSVTPAPACRREDWHPGARCPAHGDGRRRPGTTAIRPLRPPGGGSACSVGSTSNCGGRAGEVAGGADMCEGWRVL